ncbi:unnamed protein product [Nezara viridula]|uniref:Uncharacterized protein n=1 Tax=Nezara viridula TaxID=85310 RepID=A0A9P0HA53_NEZVI|nr:unnamed protein product [Nezara viridula]
MCSSETFILSEDGSDAFDRAELSDAEASQECDLSADCEKQSPCERTKKSSPRLTAINLNRGKGLSEKKDLLCGKTTEKPVEEILLTVTGAIWDESTPRLRITHEEERPIKNCRHKQNMKVWILRWAGHVARSNPYESLYTTMDASIEGKRPRGMPNSRWIGLLNQFLPRREYYFTSRYNVRPLAWPCTRYLAHSGHVLDVGSLPRVMT